jgi:hypothetical protein
VISIRTARCSLLAAKRQSESLGKELRVNFNLLGQRVMLHQ